MSVVSGNPAKEFKKRKYVHSDLIVESLLGGDYKIYKKQGKILIIMNNVIQYQKRIEYIDIAKGLGMILVVIGHCINGKTFPGTWIWSFHMPLFFIISGLCFSEKRYPSFRHFVINKVKTLLLPCIYFSILTTLFSTVTNNKAAYKSLFTENLPGALWFVLVLFFSELIYYFIRKCGTNNIIIFVSLLIGIMLNRYDIKLSHSICSVFTATFYYGLGHILKSKLKRISSLKNKIIFGFILLSIPGVLVFVSKQTINLSNNYIPRPEIVYVLTSILGTVGILLLSMLKFNNTCKSVILFIGKNTFTILSLHMLFIGISSQYIMPTIQNKFLYKLYEQVFIWVLLYFSIIFINKNAKWILGK